jgi:ABC-type bacteriocin/lantibiotic exporter with double-glycine peptidase domain
MPGNPACRFFAVLLLGGVLFAADGDLVWLDVPFIKQEKNGCGAASIWMVREYWQRLRPAPQPVADADEIQRSLYASEAHGIYASELEHYFRQHGFRAFAFRGQWSDLKEHLEKGRPLIVALEPQRAGPLHYVVVAGLDERHGIVLKNDPAERKLLKQDRSDFERAWKAAGNWTLLAVPRQDGD